MFASLISVGVTAFGLAGSWTLERLGIDRVGAPRSNFELVEYSLIAPKVVEPPPPPPDIIENDGGGVDGGASAIEDIVDPTQPSVTIPEAGKQIPEIGSSGQGSLTAVGDGNCRPPLCGIGNNAALMGGGGTCVGPHCGVAKKPEPPPAEVSYTALHCIACEDPDRAALRRTASSMRKRSGSVSLRFCVDARGKVESSSIDLTDSFGDVDVDRIVRSALANWRFKPMEVDGEPRRACTKRSFHITFD